MFTFILLFILFVALFIFGVTRPENDLLQFLSTLFGLMGMLFTFTLSFLANASEVKTTYERDFIVEKTERRVIVTVVGKEFQFTDFVTVSNIDKLKSVTVTQKFNAWGLSNEKVCVLNINQ